MSDRTWSPLSDRFKTALEHIAITCERSRQQTRRIQWIKIRAESALNGTEAWREIDLPTNGESENDRLRRENIRLKAELAEAQSQLADEERLHSQTIDERDKAEECIGAVYNEIVGEWPEWSNLFGYQDAIDTVSEHVAARDKELAEARADAYDFARLIVRDLEPCDHACSQCRPHSSMLVDGFVCSYHRAEALAQKGK